ncbi:serine hydrolase [Allobranchiibius sp. CTAmp26]|uniref:serine hydrolase n=1 Tax=Allobranchiibius sp. CTAmp26 TaxID=2815214 RepID=UPI001AA15B8A|nr:serine hydrolase [Allobranchiibius sp. CTAmp26]MBO1756410.1 serine hydrolase [Allobranchiibius sp. CTAmp26]
MTLRWSTQIGRVGAPPWLSEDPSLLLPAASIGKLLLLGLAAEMFEMGTLAREEPLHRSDGVFVRDSGIWHALSQDVLPAVDVCRLIGLVSDNLATNVLLQRVGLASVEEYADRLRLAPLALLDYARGSRDPADPEVAETLSVASAASLIRFMELLDSGRIGAEVREWLSLDTDLSMVADAFGLDPLAHNGIGGGDPGRFTLLQKTGTNEGIRADTGLVHAGGERTAYAVIAHWDEATDGDRLPEVVARMRDIGRQIRDRLESPTP